MAMMKNTGMPWLGQIPTDWKLGKVKYAFTIKKEKSTEKEPIVLSLARTGVKIRDISSNKGQLAASYEGYNPVEPNDLLLNPMDLVSGANCNISKVSGVISPAYVNLRPKTGFEPRYYDYYFKTQYWNMGFFAHGKGVSFENRWTLNDTALKDYYIPMPPSFEQQAIADYLDQTCSKIDEIIAEAKASIDEYKELKQSVIFEAVTKGFDKNVEMKAVNLEYLDSCPLDWNILPVSILFDFFGGFAYKSDRFCEETNNQVVRLGNVKDDELRLNSNPVYVSDEYADDSSKAAIKVDDILFTMTGTRGKGDYFYTLIITEDDLKEKNLFLNQRVGCFRKAYHTVYMPYYNYLLKSPKIRERVFLYETGTANQGNIGIENINRIRLYNPPMEVQKNIVRMLNQKCNTIDSLISEKESLINDLEAYKKSLIFEVVTGKRRVV